MGISRNIHHKFHSIGLSQAVNQSNFMIFYKKSVRLQEAVALEKLRPATLLKKRLWYRCFPVNFVKFLRTPFFIEHLWWLLLNIQYIKSAWSVFHAELNVDILLPLLGKIKTHTG